MAIIEDAWDELTIKLPTWAQAPRGKGVTNALRAEVMTAASRHPGVFGELRARHTRSYQALVSHLIEQDAELAKDVVSKVLGDYRRKHSKRYSLD